MSEELFVGIARAGPRDGRELRSRAPFYRVPLLPDGWAPPSNPPSATCDVFEYRFVQGAWYPMSKKVC